MSRLLLASMTVFLVAEYTPWRWVQVKHQREDGLAGNIVKLNFSSTQVLASSEGVDLVGFRGLLRSGRIIVGVLDIDFASAFAGKDVWLAAAEPDVSSGPWWLLRSFVVLKTDRVYLLEALDLVSLKKDINIQLWVENFLNLDWKPTFCYGINNEDWKKVFSMMQWKK